VADHPRREGPPWKQGQSVDCFGCSAARDAAVNPSVAHSTKTNALKPEPRMIFQLLLRLRG
jgi:hypothetical protein